MVLGKVVVHTKHFDKKAVDELFMACLKHFGPLSSKDSIL